jgi:menaquinol-cytochrome c reductase iron-sulfur subunit
MTNHTPTPRSEEPQDVQKRNFIKGLTASVLGVITLFLTIPFVQFLLPVTSEGDGNKFVKVPNFSKLAVGKPTKLSFESIDKQAYMVSSVVYDVWVTKLAEDKAVVYSPLCPHLNCRYTFVDNLYKCPCHGSVFNPEGKCIAGPSPRPLDTLPYKVEGGELFVKWELFKAGIPAKIEA